MKSNKRMAVAAASAATIAVFLTLTSCEGRKMSNMEPTGETVQVEVDTLAVDSLPTIATNTTSRL